MSHPKYLLPIFFSEKIAMYFQKQKINILFLFSLCLILSACDTVSYITINIKEPANIILPSAIRDAIVLNNVIMDSDNAKHSFIYQNEEQNIELPSDTIPFLICNSLWQSLLEEDYFDHVDVLKIAPDLTTATHRLTDSGINDLLETTDTDIIIALNKINTGSQIKLEEITEYGLLQATCDVFNHVSIDLYVRGNKLTPMQLSDTIFWEGFGLNEASALYQLPYLEDAVIAAAEKMGETAMQKLIPHWTAEYRKYFSSTKGDMKKAGNFVKKNDWESAFAIWTKKYEETNSLNQRAQCAANIALYYEIQNLFDEAISWSGQAVKEFQASGSENDLKEAQYLQDYIMRLKVRKKDNDLLDKQENNM